MQNLITRALTLLPAICLACYAASSDGPVLSALQKAVNAPGEVHVVKRVPVTQELDVVIALATERGSFSGKATGFYVPVGSTIGLFLQQRAGARLVFSIDLRKYESPSEKRVERVTASGVVLSCWDEKSFHGSNEKFVFNLHARSLIRHFQFEPLNVERRFTQTGNSLLVALNGKQGPFASVLINESEAAPFHLSALPAKNLLANMALSRFGPGGQFRLVQESTNHGHHLVVEQAVGERTRHIALPQTTYREFARIRPDNVRNGNTRGSTTIEEEIGPWQVIGETLWFAKTFYDAEGDSGVGGFGYFDAASRTFKIIAPPEIVGYATTAMLVEADAIWLGIASRGEYGNYAHGLLRYDRGSEKCTLYPMVDLVSSIVRTGQRLVMATDFGTAIWENSKLRRFFIDRNSSGGKNTISEAN